MHSCSILKGLRSWILVSESKVSAAFSALVKGKKIWCIWGSSLRSAFFFVFFEVFRVFFLKSLLICFWRCWIFCMPTTAKKVWSKGIISSILSITPKKISSAEISTAQRASRKVSARLKATTTCSSTFLFLERLIYGILFSY